MYIYTEKAKINFPLTGASHPSLVFYPLSCYRETMKLKNIAGFLSASLLAAIIALSCASGPVSIPDDMTVAEMVQRAQEASDRNKYKISLQYYETIIERFPMDIDNVIAAEYEIAFIHYKQKKYDISKIEFNDLLERYNIPDEELLPPQFKVLSLKILERITEIEESRAKKVTAKEGSS